MPGASEAESSDDLRGKGPEEEEESLTVTDGGYSRQTISYGTTRIEAGGEYGMGSGGGGARGTTGTSGSSAVNEGVEEPAVGDSGLGLDSYGSGGGDMAGGFAGGGSGDMTGGFADIDSYTGG